MSNYQFTTLLGSGLTNVFNYPKSKETQEVSGHTCKIFWRFEVVRSNEGVNMFVYFIEKIELTTELEDYSSIDYGVNSSAENVIEKSVINPSVLDQECNVLKIEGFNGLSITQVDITFRKDSDPKVSFEVTC